MYLIIIYRCIYILENNSIYHEPSLTENKKNMEQYPSFPIKITIVNEIKKNPLKTYFYRRTNKMQKTDKKISLREKTKKLKSKRSVTNFFNSIINRAVLGEEVFNEKTVKNLFTINKIDTDQRNKVEVQYEYLEALLHTTTPNYTSECKSFNFNSTKRVGWMILEFDIKSHLSGNENITHTREYIEAEIGLEPTLIAIQENIILVGYLFPNPPTTLDLNLLDKYIYFKDVRTALTHSLEANWDVTIDKYNETKIYSNFLENAFYLSGNIFEIGMFQEMLDSYKETPMFERIIRQKQSYGGYKSGITKRAMTLDKRRELTVYAAKGRSWIAINKMKNVIRHIIKTEKEPNFSIKHIVGLSKEICDKGLCHKTVAKYLKVYKKRYVRFINRTV